MQKLLNEVSSCTFVRPIKFMLNINAGCVIKAKLELISKH